MSPASRLPLRELTHKLCMLVALTSAEGSLYHFRRIIVLIVCRNPYYGYGEK